MGVLAKVRAELDSLSITDIEDRYLDWVLDDQYLIFHSYSLGFNSFIERRVASLSPKRGNPRYCYRIKKKFGQLYNFLSSDYTCIGDGSRTNVLFCTLTYDRSLCNCRKAWENIGVEFNRFLSALKKRYGSIFVARCFEAYPSDGYPHIHCVLVFLNHAFPYSIHRHIHFKKSINALVTRVKLIIPDEDNDFFAQCWHSFVDVEAVENLRKALGYIGKYISKSACICKTDSSPDSAGSMRGEINLKSVRTLAMCWVYRKRAFSIGHRFKRWLLSLSSPPKEQGDLGGGDNLNTQYSSGGTGGNAPRYCYDSHKKSDLIGLLAQLKPSEVAEDVRLRYAHTQMSLFGNGVAKVKWKLQGIIGKGFWAVPKNRWNYGLTESQGDFCDWYFKSSLDDGFMPPDKALPEPFPHGNTHFYVNKIYIYQSANGLFKSECVGYELELEKNCPLSGN